MRQKRAVEKTVYDQLQDVIGSVRLPPEDRAARDQWKSRAKEARRKWKGSRGEELRDSNPAQYWRPGEIAVAGYQPRPMASETIYDRLESIAVTRRRRDLADHLAETCYECFAIEHLFRELIDCHPDNLDRILTALVNLEISLTHLADHWRQLKPALALAIRHVDASLSRRMRPRMR